MGFISKLFGRGEQVQPRQPKIVRDGEWETQLGADGTPSILCKRGKEWLSSSRVWVSPSRFFFLHVGFNGNSDECLALTSQVKGLKIREMDEGVEAAVVTDAGAAYVLTDEGNLYTMTPDKAGQRRLCDDRPDAHILTPRVCVIAYEEEPETVIVKGVYFVTGKSWQRKLRYKWPEDGNNEMIAIAQADQYVAVTVPDGSRHLLSEDGSLVEHSKG